MPERLRVLVVHCHPCPESWCTAICDTVCNAVRAGGHDLDLLDLHSEGFDPVMGAAERRGYHDEGPNLAPVRAHADRLRAADALIFVYPTWWFGLPAMLKGWLDRVLVPGFAFEMPTAGRGLRPGLTHIHHLGIFTSCGADRWTSAFVGFPGRRTILRGLRANCHPLARTGYAAIYRVDGADDASRAAFLAAVPPRIARLLRPRRVMGLRLPWKAGLRDGARAR